MDAVIEDLDPRQRRQEGPQMPRRLHLDANFHVVQLAKQALRYHVARGDDMKGAKRS